MSINKEVMLCMESKRALDAAGIIAQLPIWSPRLEALSVLTR